LLTSSIGITIGAVVVPQGMAYAKLANLEVQFGLYSSFMGVIIYWFFATSKDITIGVRGGSAQSFAWSSGEKF
jgi:MFS superfamily sulfate permease-like transporter